MLDLMPELDVAAVVRQTGVSGYSRHRPRLETTVREVLGDLPREGLLAPAIARQSHPVTRISDEEISLKDGVTLPGRGLREIFGGATELVAMVVTIGPALEQRVTAYLDGREALRGLALDAIGNAALGWLCRQGCARVRREAAARGQQTGAPVSPGESDTLDLEVQAQLLKLAGASAIGVSLSHGGIMLPRKSLSQMIGSGVAVAPGGNSPTCGHCRLRETCHYRMAA